MCHELASCMVALLELDTVQGHIDLIGRARSICLSLVGQLPPADDDLTNALLCAFLVSAPSELETFVIKVRVGCIAALTPASGVQPRHRRREDVDG